MVDAGVDVSVVAGVDVFVVVVELSEVVVLVLLSGAIIPPITSSTISPKQQAPTPNAILPFYFAYSKIRLFPFHL